VEKSLINFRFIGKSLNQNYQELSGELVILSVSPYFQEEIIFLIIACLKPISRILKLVTSLAITVLLAT
jgi:hypothetical protein